MFRLAIRLVRHCGPRVSRAAGGAAVLLLLTSAATGGAQPAPGQSLTVHLEPGWNNVAYFGPASEPALALTGIAGRYSSVWHWDAATQRYLSYRPDSPAPGDLDRLQPGRCYWIVMAAPADLFVATPIRGLVPALARGWNNFVYTGGPGAVAETLTALAGHFNSVYGWDAVEQRFRVYSGTAGSDLLSLTPYECYWLNFS